VPAAARLQRWGNRFDLEHGLGDLRNRHELGELDAGRGELARVSASTSTGFSRIGSKAGRVSSPSARVIACSAAPSSTGSYSAGSTSTWHR
jgi:hypothetical protein